MSRTLVIAGSDLPLSRLSAFFGDGYLVMAVRTSPSTLMVYGLEIGSNLAQRRTNEILGSVVQRPESTTEIDVAGRRGLNAFVHRVGDLYVVTASDELPPTVAHRSDFRHVNVAHEISQNFSFFRDPRMAGRPRRSTIIICRAMVDRAFCGHPNEVTRLRPPPKCRNTSLSMHDVMV